MNSEIPNMMAMRIGATEGDKENKFENNFRRNEIYSSTD